MESAQAAYDAAVSERTNADKVVNDAARKVMAARDRLDKAKRAAAAAIPVDRNARQLVGGGAVTPDHRELKPNGQQKDYVVLSEAERAKGFVRPVRRTYTHVKCGVATTMGQSIAETYARDPHFYSGTFCVGCGSHFNLFDDTDVDTPNFIWEDGTGVGT